MSDGQLFFCFIIAIIVCVCIVIAYKNKNKVNYPEFTEIDLPSKIHPQRTVDDHHGVGTFMLNMVTFGGHGELKKAIYNYETSYIEYARSFNGYIDDMRLMNEKINELGRISFDIFHQLEKSRDLIGERDVENEFDKNVSIINQRLGKIDFLINQSYENSYTGVSLLQGVGVGGLAAVGSWVFVSLLGTASTGTAIATLSGAAAYNATLAWFGGGAIAAGGGGMAAGATTLGLIFAIPAIAIATYKTHSKVSEVDNMRFEVECATNQIDDKRYLIHQSLPEVEKQIHLMQAYYEKLELANQTLEEIIYPNGIRSKIKRKIDSFLNQDFYSSYEVDQIEKLTKLVEEIYAMFNQSNIQSQSLLEYRENG